MLTTASDVNASPKPRKLSPEAWRDSIPAELRAANNWVGHRSKVPCHPRTERAASVSNPETWGTFAEALDFYRRTYRDASAGVGFVFTEREGITAVDLDHVVSVMQAPDGAVAALRWRPEAAEVETLFKGVPSYAEVSPGGGGVHVFVKGPLPAGTAHARKLEGDANVEVWDRARYVTITGLRLNIHGIEPWSGLERVAAFVGVRAEDERPVEAPEPERADEVAAALTFLDPDMTYPEWIKVGMALKAGLGETGRALWIRWSRKGSKYSPGTPDSPEAKWESFHRSGVGLGSLLWMAQQAGWKPEAPLRSRPEDVFAPVAPANDSTERPGSSARVVPLTEVKRTRYEWLWEDRIAYGYITLTVGDPEVGKSIMLMDLVARLSAGVALPGQVALPPMAVLLLNAEDGADDVIKGRIAAAGGDLAKVYVLNVNGAGQIHLPDDVSEVEKLVEQTGARLIVVDPLDTALPMKIDAHRAQHIRTALTPLWQMAKRRGIAVTAVVHMNKKTGDNLSAMQRIAGSVGLPAAARSTMFVVRADPAKLDGARQVVQDKASHARHGAVPTLQFDVESVPDPDFPGATVAKVRWLDNAAVAVDANAALMRARPTPRDEAAAWLEAQLSGKGPVAAATIQAEARKAGISDITLRRAKGDLGVVARKVGGRGTAQLWVWELETYAEEPGGST